MATCHELVFQMQITAGFYSTLAGVLAGFAFAGLLGLISTHDGPVLTAYATAARVLLVAFLGLVVSSVAYAVMAGHAPTPQLATEEPISGLAFAVAGLLLFYAVALLFESTVSMQNSTGAANKVLSDLGRFLRTFGGLFLAPLLNSYLYLGIEDYMKASKTEGHGNPGFVNVLAVSLLVAHAAFALALWFTSRGDKRPKLCAWEEHVLAPGVLPNVGLAAIIAAGIVLAPLEIQGECYLAPDAFMAIVIAAYGLVMTLASWTLLRGPAQTH